MMTMKTLLMIAALLAAAPLAAQSAVPAANGAPPPSVEIPATRAGGAMRGLMEAVNATDDVAVRDWTTRMLPAEGWMGWTPERWTAALLRLREQSGGLEPLRLMERGDPGYLAVIFRARNGAGRVGIELTADSASGRVGWMELHSMPAPGPRPALPTGPLPDAEVAAAV